MRILFTSPGRRVELIKTFRENAPAGSILYGADFDRTCPASFFLDGLFEVPFKIDDAYIKSLLKICIDKKIDLLIPLIDPELLPLAKAKEHFSKVGTTVMISNEEMIEISRDKFKTFERMNQIGIPSPKTILGKDLASDSISYPIILKPRSGSSSKGVFVIKDKNELPSPNIYKNENYIAQELIKGYEVTVDILSDGHGRCIEGVQRKRLKVRGGEVERAITIKHRHLHSIVEKLVEQMMPFGVINVQFIFDEIKQRYLLMEINPRFGGGYPLAYYAGANYPKMLIKILAGEEIEHTPMSYEEDKYMLRYDEAVYSRELKEFC